MYLNLAEFEVAGRVFAEKSIEWGEDGREVLDKTSVDIAHA